MSPNPFFHFSEKLTKLMFPLNLKKPYILTAVGIVGDYISSVVGLSIGCYETHPTYSPLKATVFWFIILTVLRFTLRKYRVQERIMMAAGCVSLAGLINNLIVIIRLVI